VKKIKDKIKSFFKGFKNTKNAGFVGLNGYALLELIVATFIILVLVSMVPSMTTNTIIFQKEQKTQNKLIKLTEGFLAYYDLYGSYPSKISDFEILTSVQDPQHDAWDQPIHFYTNVQIDGTTYPAVFISNGKNGQMDSQISGSTVNLSDQDLYALVTTGMINTTNREKTREKLNRANAAYDVYVKLPSHSSECSTPGSTQCVIDMCSDSVLSCDDTYDQWGHLFVVNSTADGLISCGPDGTCQNSDDVQ